MRSSLAFVVVLLFCTVTVVDLSIHSLTMLDLTNVLCLTRSGTLPAIGPHIVTPRRVFNY